VIVIIAILLVWAYRTDRISFFWGIFFLITLFPVMNLLPINAQMSEHFLYIPSIGFFMVFTGMIYSISRLKRFHGYQWLPAVILTLIIFCCVVITIDRNADWRDEITLFQKTTESSPRSYRAHFNLGVAYYNAGLYNEAIIEFRNALELNPESIDARQNIEKAQKKFEEISRGGTVK
jgi:tetratricopeptide (TPR) repeat protein